MAFNLPKNEQLFAEERGYIGPGWPLLKRVAAQEGDQICLLNNELFINGKLRAAVRKTDSSGRNLQEISLCRVLVANENFLLGDFLEQSYDSRYFGLIEKNQLQNPDQKFHF